MTSLKDQDPQALVGRKFRFVVSSAEEAVTLIRENLGPNARVLTVRQVEGKGLNRFLSAPKLEVIATIPQDNEASAEEQQPASENPQPPRQRAPEASDQQASAGPARPATPARKAASAFQAANEPAETPEGRPTPATPEEDAPARGEAPAAPEPRAPLLREPRTGKEATSGLGAFLRAARFDESLLSRLEHSPEWPRLSSLPRQQALAEVFQWLGEEFRRVEPVELSTRIAFLGTPGVGKTTALCKQLAELVFVQQSEGLSVLKLDHDAPNPDDALRTYCDVLGLPLRRDPQDVDLLEEDATVYLDVPGLSLRDNEAWEAARARLDALGVASRVWVVNAAYEGQLLKESIQLGHRLAATHLVFTHLDEVTQPNRLWPYLLRSGLPTLFFSEGPGVSGECARDVLNHMMDRALPAANGA
jgi:flagellar biosynthesis protein FlhF